MTYGLGIELTETGIRISTAAPDGVAGFDIASDITEVPTVLFVKENGVTIGTREFEQRSSDVGAITDIVGQFTVDRVWFAGGRMFTPDSAMRGLLKAVHALVTEQHREPPGAVTVSALPDWDSNAIDRLKTIVADFQSPRVMLDLDARGAARNAATRLPSSRNNTDPGRTVSRDMPLLESSIGGKRLRASFTELPEPIPASTSSGYRRALIGSGAAILALVATFMVATTIRSGRVFGTDKPVPSIASTPSTVATADIGSLPPISIGLVANNGASEAAGAVTRINESGGIFGKGVTLAQRNPGTDTAAATRALISANSVGIVAGVVGSQADAVAGAAGSSGVTICMTSTGPSSSIRATVFLGGPTSCVTLFALAAAKARSNVPARVGEAAKDLLDGRGLACDSFVDCKRWIDAGQAVNYLPTEQPLSLFVSA